ncbi:MAG: CarD family transcriptional regulator [Bdellovibrionota bacterium]|jgi:CarD family transcriptional regulator
MSTKSSIKPQTKSALTASVRNIITKANSKKRNGIAAKKVAAKATKTNGTVVPMCRPIVQQTAVDFKAGDMVVYPGHGVGKITSLAVSKIGGTEHKFFEISFGEDSSSKGMIIKVPVAQAQTVGLRRIADKKAIDQVYNILKDRKCKVDTQTWNRRFREYSQKIKTGSVFEIAEVLRDLSVLSSDKELSFGEKRMLDTAQNLLVTEISVAKSKTQEKVIGEIQALFA